MPHHARRRAVCRVAPLLAGLAVLAASAPVAAASRWTEVRTPHFRVIGTAGARELREVARQFEQFRAVFDRATDGGIRAGERPLVVFAVRNEQELRQLIPKYWAMRGQSKPAGLFVSGVERHHVALRLDASRQAAEAAADLGLSANPYHIVFHEYVHALLQGSTTLPLWMHEGLAEYYAGAQFDRDRAMVGRAHAFTILALRERTLLPMAQLLGATRESPLYTDEQKTPLFYAQSWALVHYMRVGRQGQNRARWAAYRQELATGRDPVEAGRRAFGDLGALQGEIAGYVQSSIFGAELVNGVTRVGDGGWTFAPLSDTHVDLHTAEFQLAMGERELAGRLLDRLRSPADQHPQFHELSAWLAEAEGRDADARASARRAIELGSTSARVHHLLAERLLVESAMHPTDEIAGLLERSIALDEGYAPAHERLAETYLALDRPVHEVLETVTRAIRLAPDRLPAYLVASEALLRADRPHDAIQVCEQALRLAQDDDARARVQSVLARARRPPTAATPPPSPAERAAPATGASPGQEARSTDPPPAIHWTVALQPTGVDMTAWARDVSSRLPELIGYPREAIGHVGRLVVDLAFGRDGVVRRVTVVESCGNDELDQAVRRALESPGWSVPLPRDFPAEQLVARLTLYFNQEAPPGAAR